MLGLGAGLLFHGADHTQGGSNNSTTSKWSFGDKPEDLAYLIIALYPSSTPDKYWSFCRHLWVLSGGLSGTSSPAGATVGDEVPEDEAMAMESAGLPVQVVEGPSSNIKVTVEADLAFADLVLRKRGAQ